MEYNCLRVISGLGQMWEGKMAFFFFMGPFSSKAMHWVGFIPDCYTLRHKGFPSVKGEACLFNEHNIK